MIKKKKIIALIGIGYWGEKHLKYLAQHKNIDIKYIFYKKKFPKKIANKYKKIEFTNNLSKIYNDKKVEYVNIVTPINTHLKLVTKFINKNKNVLVEKPLYFSEKIKKKLSLILKKNKKKLYVSYPYIYSRTFSMVREFINKKKLGKLKFIEISMEQAGRFSNKFSIFDLLGVHALSITSLFINLKNVNLKNESLIKRENITQNGISKIYEKKKLIGILKLSSNYFGKNRIKELRLYYQNSFILANFSKIKSTIEFSKYKVIRNKTYLSPKVIEIKKFTNDDNHNLKKVIDNFLFKTSNQHTLNLTYEINRLLKN